LARPKALDEAALQAALQELASSGWALEDAKLTHELRFANFSEAFAFMTRVAMVAEAMDHHPEWFNVYGTLRIQLTTHDAGGISELDLAFAREVNRLFG